jgi:hypothetical protein
MPEIPVGFCQCGCGGRTKIAPVTRPKRGEIAGQPRRYCRRHQHRCEDKPTEYVSVSHPEHPRANSAGLVYEHILIAEAAVGHFLPRSVEVHHVDEDSRNNERPNLVVCEDHAYHQLLHQRTRAYEACGDANALRCYLCHGYDRQDNISVTQGTRSHNGQKYPKPYHRDCAASYMRASKAKARASAGPREQESRRSA